EIRSEKAAGTSIVRNSQILRGRGRKPIDLVYAETTDDTHAGADGPNVPSVKSAGPEVSIEVLVIGCACKKFGAPNTAGGLVLRPRVAHSILRLVEQLVASEAQRLKFIAAETAVERYLQTLV